MHIRGEARCVHTKIISRGWFSYTVVLIDNEDLTTYMATNHSLQPIRVLYLVPWHLGGRKCSCYMWLY